MGSYRDQYSFAFCDNPKCDLHAVKVEVGCRELQLTTNLDPSTLGDRSVPEYRTELRHRHVHYGKVINLCGACEGAVNLFVRRF